MNTFPKFLGLAAATMTAFGCSLITGDNVPADKVSLAIHNVTVIDPETETVSAGMNVYIDNGRIIAIRPLDDDNNYQAEQRIDGAGKFLVPGLLDMHVHLAHPNYSSTTLALLLANGVTGVREMSGDCWEPRGELFACIADYRKLQQAIETGDVIGPQLLAISSAIVRDPGSRQPPNIPEGAADFITPSTPEQAQQLVNYLVERGVDFIKPYDGIDRASYLALLDAANENQLEVSGHVPLAVDVSEASTRGQRTIEHANVIPYDCSDFGSELRQRVNALLAGREDASWPNDLERLSRTIQTFNPARCATVLKTLADNNTWYVPTHETREMDALASKEAYRNDPRLEFIVHDMKKFWLRDLERTARASAETATIYQSFYQHGLAITRMAHEAGVNIMAGTDANDTLSFPGFSLHDELQHLAMAGLTPMEILRTATTNPARYLERHTDLGGVSVGKQANLLLLDADPLDDIRNTTRIAAVILAGRVHDRAALDAMLSSVRQQVAASETIESITVDADTLAQYAGHYLMQSSNLDITILHGEDGLQITAPGMPVMNLLASSPTQFFMAEDDTKFEFVVDENGKVTGLLATWTGGRSELAPRTE